MASRVYQVGTIVSRVKRLLETGVLKEHPLWLDVVETFPPDSFPKHNRTSEGGRPPEIVYPEDDLKRKFYDKYTIVKQPDKCLSLFEEKPSVQTICDRFVSEQLKRRSLGDEEVEAARRALWVLRSEGVDIRVKQTENTFAGDAQDESKSNVPSTLNSLRELLERMHPRKPS